MDMVQITADQVTPALRGLLRQDEPQAPRCFAVLDGVIERGMVLTDDPANPSWAVVQEPLDNSLYFGGGIDADLVALVVSRLRLDGDVLIGMWLDDPRLALLPPAPGYDGRTLEFYDRPLKAGLWRYVDRAPDGCAMRRLDRDLVLKTAWGPESVSSAGGLDQWEQTCLGYCLMRGGEILSDATVGPPSLGLYELGVFTQPAHRGKGYGTAVSARLVREIEARGGRTYWNCAKQNVASAAIARKLGYRIEKEYRCMQWERLR